MNHARSILKSDLRCNLKSCNADENYFLQDWLLGRFTTKDKNNYRSMKEKYPDRGIIGIIRLWWQHAVESIRDNCCIYIFRKYSIVEKKDLEGKWQDEYTMTAVKHNHEDDNCNKANTKILMVPLRQNINLWPFERFSANII